MRRNRCSMFGFLFASIAVASQVAVSAERHRPNIILMMTDDQGWGQTGYYDHPELSTPHLDSMASAGLRFDRFYAGAPNCSPTRATVLTGRSNDRTGVQNHGYPLRLQERTVAQALGQAGYATGHFGKWHLNGLSGPGVPILATDERHPGRFGFDNWLSVSNFFDRDPIMSRRGDFEEFEGDSSEIIVDQALQFIREQVAAERPFFVVVWYGTPHSPMVASEEDRSAFAHLPLRHQHHYGELVAMDRSIGTLRAALRDLGLENDTLVWFCSDNGGLRPFGPATVGGLRGAKNTVFEGGLRVPGIIHWPAGITVPRVSSFPSVTMDIFPTLVEIVGLNPTVMIQPQDGMSLLPMFERELEKREKPIPFRHTGRGALVDNDLKFVVLDIQEPKYQLFDLVADPTESHDLYDERPADAERLREAFLAWSESVDASVAGKDYPERKVTPANPPRRSWTEVSDYEPYLEQWKNRPEYRSRLQP